MPQHKLAVATIGLLALPGLIFAGYPDVPRSHWASSSVEKVGQVGVMTARSDGRFHGEKAATRYEVATAVSKAMAEFENRLVTDGRSPEDIVPYIERINLYVADEIDHLKQAQKELRATLNEILERLERREAHSTPLPPPAPPQAHPHRSVVPQTELRASTKEVHEQKIHAVEGATTVNTHSYEAVKKTKKGRTAPGKIAAVEGAIEVKGDAATVEADGPMVTEAPFAPAVADKSATVVAAVPAKPAAAPATTPAAPAQPAVEGKKWPSDEAAWDNMPAATKEEEESAALDGIDGEPAKLEAKPEEPKSKPAKTKSKQAIPRAAPVNTSSTPKVDSHHAGAVVPESAVPHSGAKTEAKKPAKSKKAKKEAKADKVPAKSAAKAEKPKTEEQAAKVEGIHDDEVFESPEIKAGAGEPTDEDLSNWKPTQPVKPAVTAPAAAAPSTPAAKTGDGEKAERSTKASTILTELRTRAKK